MKRLKREEARLLCGRNKRARCVHKGIDIDSGCDKSCGAVNQCVR